MREIDDRGYLVFTDTETTEAVEQHTEKQDMIRACWLSYLEWNPQTIKTKAEYQNYMKNLLATLHRIGTTDLFVQVRAFADAIYPSAYFEPSAWIVGRRGKALPFDYLSVILDEAQACGIRVHAWINPYRVLADKTQKENLGKATLVERMLRKQGKSCFMETASGLYLQPASKQAQKLILSGVQELLDAYPLAGIHLDDYFYPPDVDDEDHALYENYLEKDGSLSLHAWRCEHVSTLLQKIYKAVHASDASRVLSVSPGGDPQRDDSVHCADVSQWCSETGYCDWIVPQLYYGFQNETMPFLKMAKEWKRLRKNQSVRLIGGLAVYKIGKTDTWAGETGREEWMQRPSLLAKQAKALRRLRYDGCALYSAKYVSFHEKVCTKAFQFFNDVV